MGVWRIGLTWMIASGAGGLVVALVRVPSAAIAKLVWGQV